MPAWPARLHIGLCCLLLLLAGCSKPPLYQRTGYVFGTKVEISFWGLPEASAERHAHALLAELDRLHARLHAWQPSPVTRLNAAFKAGESVSIDAELIELVRQSRRYEVRSDGLFNPAIGELVALWGFHDDSFTPHRPDPAKLAALTAAAPTLADLTIEQATIRSGNPSVNLDFGGMAKGWALDRAAAYLRHQRISHALINIGGNVLALGRKGEEPWVVGLQHPRQPRAMAMLALQDGEAIGTSGDYQRYFELDGVRYNHLIDPRSGEPAHELQAATVIAPPSREAGAISDVATKPLFIGGSDSALAYAHRFGLRDVLLIAPDGSAYLTASMQARLRWLVQPPHVYRLR
ncbi:FAD:protein FMN transferase [Chitinolyticbacter meiyuanensis]|uniref:FAD:protein FMN transferase n=1 Tax=Chitinolyticbacter meiyuanensis TaxID=682798 RepID=UPI0011E5FC68|nr:FAD:protein FMN transferase [Chitinolyticbacter meiyuanensis]